MNELHIPVGLDRVGARLLPPAALTGAVELGLHQLLGRDPSVFIDALGERLAFERMGTRLYEAMLAKAGAAEHSDAALSLYTLRRIRDDKARHFKLLEQALRDLGADPTAQTPSTDGAAVTGQSVLAVLTDPQTTLTHACHALLTAELIDNAGWELLIELAEEHGQQKMAAQFRDALADEREHLTQVRRWLDGLLLLRATPAEVFIP